MHVRINLQTGKKEAKLLDENEEQKENASQNADLAEVPQDVWEKYKGHSKQKLKISKKLSDALKNIPKDALGLEHSPEQMEKIKKQYKSYAEIKQSFDAVRQNFKTDAEIIRDLIGEFRNSSQEDKTDKNTKKQLKVLEDFNYLVHQIDNAMMFIDDGGLEHILLPLVVNQTNVALRVKAMRVLGALSQNNPKAQIKVFERNFGSHLSQILVNSVHTEELSTALYAFGSLLRKFPHAQQRILSTCGTQALITVLSKECELKIKAKALTIISDLIVEKKLVLDSIQADNAGNSEEKQDPALAAAQYAELNYPEWLKIHSYCQTVESLLDKSLYSLIEQPDLMEYFAQALQTTLTECHTLWSKNAQLRHVLLTIRNRYIHSSDEFQLEVAQQIDQVIKALYDKVQQQQHEEL